MELSVAPVKRSRKRSGLGRCRHFFWLGVIFDAVGVAVLFTGVFANLLFYDMLVYLGSIIIFFSLLWWISWYTGNIELLPEETKKRASRVPSTAVVHALRQSVSHRFSLTIDQVSSTFLRIHRRRRRRQRTLQSTPSLKMTVSGLVEQLEKENKDTEGGESVKESGSLQDSCKENLGPKPEDDKRSETVVSPDPYAGPPWFGQQPSTQLVPPMFPPTQPLPPTALASQSLPVVSLVSVSQPLAISRSQPVVSVAPRTQPPATLALTRQPAVPLGSESHPVVLQTQFENLPQTEAQPGQGSGTQSLASQVSLMQFAAAQSFQTVDSQPVHNLEALQQTLQGTQSTSLIPEIFIKQPSYDLQVPKNQVAEGFETPPQPSQKPSQELPDIPSPVIDATPPARQAQQSVSTESAPASVEVKKSHPL
ncbi:uncharacterized protein LOC111725591 [Otolemur garnettii]|uniref:uncharacterized protein LOC111725591 n=1 Tax=Otolemur garnettii TaxID=30611 RepID=UPI000C7E8856|nr:uncharacterized protein LOC111725591 [Otolemur garnettii]